MPSMSSHVIAFRMHEALQLLLSVDWYKVPWSPDGPLVGRVK